MSKRYWELFLFDILVAVLKIKEVTKNFKIEENRHLHFVVEFLKKLST